MRDPCAASERVDVDAQMSTQRAWEGVQRGVRVVPAGTCGCPSDPSSVHESLQDFVALAKWEDRGYYALRWAAVRTIESRGLPLLSACMAACSPAANSTHRVCYVTSNRRYSSSCRASNEKAQRQLHRLTRKAVQLLREPSTGALAQAAKNMGFGDLQREGQEGSASGGTAAAAAGKNRLGKKAAAAAAAAAEAASAADRALAEPETAVAVLAATRDAATQQLAALPGWASAGEKQAALLLLEGSKYAAQLPRLTRRFAEVAGAVVAGEAAAAGAASADDLASEAAGRALELRADVAKGAKARKKKALTGGRVGQGCIQFQLIVALQAHAFGPVDLCMRPGLLPPPQTSSARWRLRG